MIVIVIRLDDSILLQEIKKQSLPKYVPQNFFLQRHEFYSFYGYFGPIRTFFLLHFFLYLAPISQSSDGNHFIHRQADRPIDDQTDLKIKMAET